MYRSMVVAMSLVILFLLVDGVGSPGVASAHRDGCHAQHSCPSDTGSYVCGDTGNYSECPGMAGTASVPSYDVAVGKTLAGSVGWTAQPTSIAYQWTRAGQPIPGATTTSYTVTVDDMGQALVLTASGTDGRGQAASASSNAVNVPPLSGAAQLGQALATVGTVLSATTKWNAPVTESYQWFRTGVAIAGATAATYVVTKDDLGQPVTLSVGGSAGSSSANASTGPVTPVATVELRLTGPRQVVRAGRTASVKGTARSVAPVERLVVTVRVWHKLGGRWLLKRTGTVSVSSSGAFGLSKVIPRSQSGAWKVQASLDADRGYLAARSPVRYFTARAR